MPSRTTHPGTRRGTTYWRGGKPVHAKAARIRRPRPQQRRGAQLGRRRGQPRPLLYAAYASAGVAAFELIVSGRFISGALFGVLALSFGVAHVGWQAHKRRKASKPAKAAPRPKPAKGAAQQRAEALEKAREAHQPDPKPVAPPTAKQEPTEAPKATNGVSHPAPATNGWAAPRTSESEPTTHAESVARNRHRCDCKDCRAQRRAARKEKATVLR